jgi:hypothetical protein
LKEIDRRLATAEEWGRTLLVLAGEPSPAQAGDDPVSADDDERDQTPGGRYQ